MGIHLPCRRRERLSAGRPHHACRRALQRQPGLRRRAPQATTPAIALFRALRRLEVGKLRPNRWGLHDMPGNVWEFTASPWTRDHASLPERPQPGKTPAVVTKGGSWFDGPEDCRAAARRRRLETELDLNLGFRVARQI